MAMQADAMGKKYNETQDRESAYEILHGRAEKASVNAEKAQEAAQKSKAGRSSQSVSEAAVKSLVRAASSSVGRTIAREIMRGVMGSLRR